MDSIEEDLWTYVDKKRRPQRVPADKIRTDTSCGHTVSRFEDLVTKAAKLSFLNRKWFLLYQGQAVDYVTRPKTVSLYPSLFRNEPGKTGLPIAVRKQRFSKLKTKVRKLRSEYQVHTTRRYARELKRMETHYELAWAILQHYGVVPTPYLDLTGSLRVAASFATLTSKSGYVYVIALPYPTGTITHAVDEDIKIVRLQSACPPSAKRPHFQEGYLAGSCYVDPEKDMRKHNLARRLAAKFYIPDKDRFWSPGRFDPIPEEALFPSKDHGFDWLKKRVAEGDRHSFV